MLDGAVHAAGNVGDNKKTVQIKAAQPETAAAATFFAPIHGDGEAEFGGRPSEVQDFLGVNMQYDFGGILYKYS